MSEANTPHLWPSWGFLAGSVRPNAVMPIHQGMSFFNPFFFLLLDSCFLSSFFGSADVVLCSVVCSVEPWAAFPAD